MTESLDPPEDVARSCSGFLNRVAGHKYFTAARDFVLVHHELLTEEADAFLAEQSKDPHSSALAYSFARMRILLSRCKQVGLERAFEEERLKELIGDFLGDGRFDTKEDFVRDHPELLTALANDVLKDSAARQRSEGARQIFDTIRTLLDRCREIGVTSAFAELRSGQEAPDPSANRLIGPLRMLLAANGPAASKHVLKQHLELLDPAVDRLLKSNDPRLKSTLERIAKLLERCRRDGIDAAFPDDQMDEEESARTIADLHTRLGQFLFADSARQKRAIVEQCPDLLDPVVQVFLEQFAAQLDPRAQAWVKRHRQILDKCRSKGVDVAFARYAESLADDEPDIRDNGAKHLQRLADVVDLSARSRETPTLIPHVIAACEIHLAGTPTPAPSEQSLLHMIAGQAYLTLAKHSSGDPWDKAFWHFVEGLKTCDANSQPIIFANMNMELARVLAQLPSGDRYANQRMALRYNRAALRAWREEGADQQVAGVLLNLSHIWSHFAGGSERMNRDMALAHAREALHVLREAQLPTKDALMTLGALLVENSDSRDRATLAESIKYFQDALPQCDDPKDCVNAIFNSGVAWLEYALSQPDETRGDANERRSALHNALDHLHRSAARSRDTGDDLPSARISLTLARALAALNSQKNLQAIHSHYQYALDIVGATEDQQLRLTLLQDLGNFHCVQGQWGDASTYLFDAIVAARRLHSEGRSVASKRQTIDQQRELFGLAAYVFVKSGRADEALWLLDSGKARILGEDIRQYAARPRNVSDEVWSGYLTTSYLYRQSEWEETHGVTNYEHMAAQSDARRRALEEAINEVTRVDSSFLTETSEAVLKRDVLDERTAIITFCCTKYGSVILLLTSSGTDTIDVPDFTRNDLVALITRCPDDDGYAQEGWLGALGVYRREGTRHAFSRWISEMEPTLATVGKALIAPALLRLSTNITRLIIVPSHEAYVLPLQAVPVGDDDAVLLDKYEVTHVPSLQMLAHAASHHSATCSGSFAAVSNPTNDAELTFANYESRMASRLFDGEVLQGGEATVERVVRSLSNASIVHFACHGIFQWGEPRKSGLLLADGKLTVDDLLLGEVTIDAEREGDRTKFLCVPFDVSGVRLVTLSACDTGTSDVIHGSPSEAIALSVSFLALGVPSVISSLWAVSDLSTAILMDKMYEVLPGYAEPRSALRAAVRWLKSATAGELGDRVRAMAHHEALEAAETSVVSTAWRRIAAMEPQQLPFRDPYYWAAFIVNGI